MGRVHSNESSEFRSGWRLLIAAMLGTGLGFPTLVFYTIGIFAPALEREFGWSFASIFAGLALTPVAVLVGGPFVGYLVDRHGARKVAAISLTGLGLAYTTLGFSSGSLVQYYASWIALTVAGMGATPISFTGAVNGVFVRRRGLALGIALAGIGLFALAVKPLAAWLLGVASWRAAMIAIGLLPVIIGVPVILWGFPTLQRSSSAAGDEIPHLGFPPAGLTVKQALHTRSFWLLLIAFVPIAFATGGPLPNMENILKSVHVDPADVVVVTSLIGLTIVAGRLVGGWLMDRTWAPLVGALVLSAAAAACWLLSQRVAIYNEAMLASILLGFAAGLEVDLLSYLVARYIGLRNYGIIYGTIYGFFAVGAGIGPSVLGYSYDRFGSYSQILKICALMLVVAAFLLLFLGRYPDQIGMQLSRDRPARKTSNHAAAS